MNKRVITLTTLGVLTLCGGSAAYAADAPASQTKSKTEVTLIPGSGNDPEPVVPADPNDPDPSTGETGDLSIPFASNITFGSQEIKQGDTDYYALNKNPYVQVNDTRGGAKGWTLSVAISPFTGTTDGKELVGAELSLANGEVVTKNNQSTPAEMAQAADNTYKLNKVSQPLMIAKEGEGAGAFAAVFKGTDGKNKNVKLHVPRSGVEAESYTAELTWVLSDAPV